MQISFAPMDLLNFLFVPLMVLTLIAVKRSWRGLWDDDLTMNDRYLLQRVVIFLLLPAVVLFHELGHVVSIKLCGGTVEEFHYAFVWGYVVPAGAFTADQVVFTYLAGNLVQILIGFLALLAAFFVHSPPMVALMVYLFFWSVGSTTVMYALMSFTGLYGDWIAIYSAPNTELVAAIALGHALLIAFLAWCLYGIRPKLWYVGATQKGWSDSHKLLLANLAADPSAVNWLNLGWSYYLAGALRKSRQCLSKARSLNSKLPGLLMLEAALALRGSNFLQAQSCFSQIMQDSESSARERAQACLGLADCLLRQRDTNGALAFYEMAIACDPTLADPHYYRAARLNDEGRREEAETELLECANLEWLDDTLEEQARRQLDQSARQSSS